MSALHSGMAKVYCSKLQKSLSRIKSNKSINILPEGWVVRSATIGDAHSIANIHLKSLKWTYAGKISDSAIDELKFEERFAIWSSRILDKKLDIFVVYEKDVLLAFVDVDTINYNCKIGEVHRLYTNPDALRKRPGYFLIKNVLQYYKRNGFEYLFGWVIDNNILARRFYEKMGAVLDPNTTKKVIISGCECTALKYVYHFSNKGP